MTMDRRTRIDRVLPGMFTELADARTPDYLEAAIERASSRPQRPAWTFPERWLPMEISTHAVPTARLPWRPLGVLALIAILLIATLALLVGSQQRRLPAPFGVAANGPIAFASDGDIHVGDPSGTMIRRLTSGPAIDTDPLYSPDGRSLAFLRAGSDDGFDLMVIPADGGEPLRVARGIGYDDVLEWAPDGGWLLLATADGRLSRIDAVAPTEPIAIASDALLDPGMSAFRPPDGAEIMFTRAGGLWAVRPDGSGARMIVDNPEPENRDFRHARWSPDGSMIVFTGTIGDGEQYRLHVMNADGTGIRRLSTVDGVWVETDPRWSPDGSRIAFNHWQNEAGSWHVAPVGIVSLPTGSMTQVAEVGVSDGTLLEWSPDGTFLTALPGPMATQGDPRVGTGTLIDATTGAVTDLPWAIQTSVSWQRIAP
jgi:Tol biopolymer transport system component